MSKLRQHPNIIKFVGICFLPEFPKLPAMIMEKVPYGNLHRYLKEQGPANSMELSRKRHILLGVANGLHYLHYECEMAVVHMDLKASIVLLNDSYDANMPVSRNVRTRSQLLSVYYKIAPCHARGGLNVLFTMGINFYRLSRASRSENTKMHLFSHDHHPFY